MKINVFTQIQGKMIRCEVLDAFRNRITKKSYILIFSPIETKKDVLIPMLFSADKEIQKGIFLTEREDKDVIENRINENACEIQYSCDEGVSFEIHIHKDQNENPEEKEIRELVGRVNASSIPPEIKDKIFRDIDAKIISRVQEKFINKDSSENSVTSLITQIVKESVSLSHMPLDMLDNLIDSEQISFSIEDTRLLKAFEELIMMLGKEEVIRQDIETALVHLIECANCSKELFDVIIKHKTLSDIFPLNVLQDIRCNIVLQVPCFFDIKAVKSAGDFFYGKKEYNSALTLFEKAREISEAKCGDNKSEELPDIYNSIGCCFIGNMQFANAYEAFQQATEINQEYAVAFNNWAYTLLTECETLYDEELRRKKLAEALGYINDAIQLDANAVAYLSNRAYIEYELSQYERVVRDYNKVKGGPYKFSDIKTIVKLSIDSKIKQNIKKSHGVSFWDVKDELDVIYENETGSSRFYFEALNVYHKIAKDSSRGDASVDNILTNLMLFEFYIDELMSELAVRNPQQDIYYYTSIRSLKQLLSDEQASAKYRLPIFNVGHMNDPSEGKTFEYILSENAKSSALIEDLFNESNNISSDRKLIQAEFTFLKAFTQNSDSLPMWVHYADGGKGCCVKVSPRFFSNFEEDLDDEKALKTNPFDNVYRLYKILYIKDEKISNMESDKVEKLYKNILDSFVSLSDIYDHMNRDIQKVLISSIDKVISKLKYLFKSDDYNYEQEMRVILKRSIDDFEREDMDILFTTTTEKNEIPKAFIYTNKSLLIEEIILGPKVKETADILPFLDVKLFNNNKKVLITKSEIEYR